MRQLVGQSCVLCGQRVASIVEGDFCAECGCPVHRRCCNPPESLSSPAACPTCGADQAHIHREQFLHSQENQRTDAERRMQRGIWPLAVFGLITLFGLTRTGSYLANVPAPDLGGFLDSSIVLFAGIAGIFFTFVGIAKIRMRSRQFMMIAGVFGVVVLTGVAVRLLVPYPERTLLSQNELLTTMKGQAEELGRAFCANDHAKAADRTHPKLVEAVGGRDRLMKMLEMAANEFKAKKTSIRAIVVGDPSSIVEQADAVYAVIPFTMEFEADGQRARQESFLVGISDDGGRTWGFVDGAQAKSGKLQQLFPNFPEAIRVPEKQPLVILDRN